MKKLFTILLAAFMMFSLAACNDTPDESKSFEEAQSKFDEIKDTNDKSEIEENIKNVFGVSISLPAGSEYIAETFDIDSVSSYMVMVKGASVTAEEYFDSVKSKFNGWENAETEELALAYTADKVVYGFAVADEEEYLALVFSMTDKELMDQFVSQDTEFINEIKNHSGVSLTLPDCVESIGLPGLNNNGAKVSYGGMLLNGNGSINKAEFDEFVASIDTQLATGYTKSVEGEGDDMTVLWTSNSDPTKYFEASYFEFEGTPMTSFSYNYIDTSLLPPWPTEEINAMMGTNAGVPEYDGLYDNLIVSSYDESENDKSITIYLKGVTESELDAYLNGLTSKGFAKIGGELENSDIYWSKSITDTLYVEINGYYSASYYGDGDATIYVNKTVLENIAWPASEIAAQFGSKAAGKIPSVASAQRRTFEVYDDDYSYIYVSGVVDREIFTSYCASLEALGFTLEDEWGDSKEYLYQWDDYDRLTVSVSYTSADDAGQEYVRVSIQYKPYESFVDLPTNVQITHTTSNYYSNNPVTETITKIGEDWYFSGAYGTTYYKYNSADRTWNIYNGYKLGSAGTMTWSKDSKSYDRYAIDNKLKSALSGVYVERLIEDADEFTKGSTVTLHGQSCVEYSQSMNFGSSYGTSTVYSFNESMRIAFKMVSTVISDGEERVSSWEITEFNTSVSSFADAGITADLLPSE